MTFFFYSSEPTAQAQNRAENQNLCLFSVDDFFWRNHKNGEKIFFFFFGKNRFFSAVFSARKNFRRGGKKKVFFSEIPVFFFEIVASILEKTRNYVSIVSFLFSKKLFFEGQKRIFLSLRAENLASYLVEIFSKILVGYPVEERL